ncbi:choline dehydrogenase [Kaistia algarum]|uniref:GMC family oxidoreductase n=1 Tax=Kaistia algarum TaxID=2083279 RepID=UPI000CE8959C|nr:GMC family oxidoreductase N-terminal domain-containing protein [Kaistia algarum]MCX5515337.1 GMC family oxidoreductase N-terminal domain-containing protein [Kaistia algarum]PPE77865.1 choline dehydrogenase [Kaistia algarum]
MSEEYDYIIVGAGSAGCVLANRLTENGRYSILLLEAGGTDRRPWVQIPIGYSKTFFDAAVNWKYTTEADPGLNGKTVYWPRGKVLGGSSSINAMVYIRGQREDYDGWAAKGLTGWGFDDVLPYFKKSEDNIRGADAYHGRGGPLAVSDIGAEVHPLTRAFVKAGVEAGVPRNDDFNGPSQEGIGLYQLNIRKGIRSNTANAFLRPALRRPNLRLITGAHMTRILLQDGRAVGVAYKKGELHEARARREVILAAGSINSPQLLQLSGIGPAGLLGRHGIAVQADLPAVGQNLMDHLYVSYIWRANQKTLNDSFRSNAFKAMAGLRYLTTRRGPLSISINQGGAFVRTRPGLDRPNMQLYFVPMSFGADSSADAELLNFHDFPGFIMSASPCRPTSRGKLEIRSADPFAPPSIMPNYLSTEADVDEMLEGVAFLRSLAKAPSLATAIVEEVTPGRRVTSREDVLRDCRDRANTTFHPISTCTMGTDPRTSVVDARLRVHGLAGLRVVDASVMPDMISGNTNAPTIMIAEKGADLILADAIRRNA